MSPTLKGNLPQLWVTSTRRSLLIVRFRMSSVSKPAFVGLDNYRKLAADPVFGESLFNTLVYIAGSTVLTALLRAWPSLPRVRTRRAALSRCA